MAAPSLPRPADGDDVVLSLSRGRLISILTDTVSDLEHLTLTLHTPGLDDAQARRSRVSVQIRDHILPRLKDADMPAIVVVGGSTGAGKSTLVNSVLGSEVSEAGVLRPTTRTPVLVMNEEDSRAVQAHPVAQVCRTVLSDAVPAGLALVDASDLDSVQDANRALASRLLEAADLWLFITTAARYGDLTPWATLEEAARRGTSVAVVLNRAPATVLPEVRRDLLGRLDSLGLAESPFFVVPDAGPHEGLLPASTVAELSDWLQLLAGRHRAAGLMRRADRSVWTSLQSDLTELANELDAQDDAGHALSRITASQVEKATSALTEAAASGIAAEGSPATRWVSLASSGAPLAPMAVGKPLRRGILGRKTRQRAAALETLRQDVCETIMLRLTAAEEALVADLRREWGEAGAGSAAQDLLGKWTGPDSTIATWMQATRADAISSPAVTGLDATSVADLLMCAAGGVSGAEHAAQRLGLTDAVATCRQGLASCLRDAIHCAVPQDIALTLVPDPDTAAALRLRAAELGTLVKSGGR